MKEIAYGITEQFDWPPELLAWGEIRGKGTNLCIDSMGHKDRDGNAQTWYCHKQVIYSTDLCVSKNIKGWQSIMASE